MTQDEIIEMKEGSASAPTEIIITPPKAKGWLAFYRSSEISCFNAIYPTDYATRNYHACPPPLFVTKDDAIDEIRKYAKEMGGEARLIMVTL
jgi:hypothetical protein